jgi:hypothetical protein
VRVGWRKFQGVECDAVSVEVVSQNKEEVIQDMRENGNGLWL